MNLQQLHYIIAVNRFRSFAKAADYCGITQPTLSKMVANLEEELDVKIFDRSNRSVVPTTIGESIISQAEKTIKESSRIQEIVNEAKNSLSGELNVSVGPSIAPYILPDFIRIYGAAFPDVSLTVEERRLDSMKESLLSGRTDIAIATAGNNGDGILEIPLYEEPFWVYLAEGCVRNFSEFTPDKLSHENMWVMKEVQCLRESAFSFCKARETGRRVYEAGNIDTLVRVVDANGGFTIIPEMHLPYLSERQRENVRPLTGDCVSRRKVSLYIRHDYVREKMLESVVTSLAKVIPSRMLAPYILKGRIRL
jgi:hypothetical protein